MITYELAKQLKDAGFPQRDMMKDVEIGSKWADDVYFPSLSELIEACGELEELKHYNTSLRQEWVAYAIEQEPWNPKSNASGIGSTPEEAVANLWLTLNKHE